MEKTLTIKQRQAADHYVQNDDRSAAYCHAYDCTSLTKGQVTSRAGKLFNLPHVKVYIGDRRRAVLERVNAGTQCAEINAAWVLKRAALLADFNIRRFISLDDQNRPYYDFSTATDDDWYCIEEYTSESLPRGSGDDRLYVDKVKIRAPSKLKALELVGKHIDVGAFADKVEHSGTVTTETYELTDAERSARITALLDRARTRRARPPNN